MAKSATPRTNPRKRRTACRGEITADLHTTTMVPIAEYLTTEYDPDRDYVDGQLEERNLGEREHDEVRRDLLLLQGADDHLRFA